MQRQDKECRSIGEGGPGTPCRGASGGSTSAKKNKFQEYMGEHEQASLGPDGAGSNLGLNPKLKVELGSKLLLEVVLTWEHFLELE